MGICNSRLCGDNQSNSSDEAAVVRLNNNVITDDDVSHAGDAEVSDPCEVCLVSPRDAIALVPCGHRRFCASCVNKVREQGRGCPICRRPILMQMPLY